MTLWKAPDDTDLRNWEDLKMIGKVIVGPLLLIGALIAIAATWLF